MRHRDFVRLGSVDAAAVGLPERLTRELELTAAWQRVAGDAMARRLVPDGIRRGVLELRVEDARWLPSARALLPKLAARLAREAPGLGIRKVRLLSGGARGDAEPVDPEDASR